MFQAMAFGYLRADSPNVILESHAVNVASRRAGVVGDVDGFQGAEIELAAEVKDLDIGQDNFEDQLGGFLQAVEEIPNATSLVIARTFDEWSRNQLLDRGTLPVDKASLLERVAIWDVPKQQEALRGFEYFLARIQKSPALRDAFQEWCDAEGVLLT